jgi:hypothetical protein
VTHASGLRKIEEGHYLVSESIRMTGATM